MQTIRTLFWRSDFTYFLVSLFQIITVTKVCEVKKLPVKYKLQRSCNELLLWFKKRFKNTNVKCRCPGLFGMMTRHISIF